MEKKNTILLTVIAVATLLVAVVGATFAYFTATSSSTPANADTGDVTTAQIASVNVTSTADKNAYLEYPGGISVLGAGVQITKDAVSAGSTSTVDYDVTLTYTNGTGTALKYTIYRAEKTGEDALALAAMDAGCTLQVNNVSGEDRYAYTCTSNAETLAGNYGTKVGETATLEAGQTEQVITVDDETFALNSEDEVNNSYYYYVIVEYPNSGEQNADMGKKISLSLDVTKATVSTVADGQ